MSNTKDAVPMMSTQKKKDMKYPSRNMEAARISQEKMRKHANKMPAGVCEYVVKQCQLPQGVLGELWHRSPDEYPAYLHAMADCGQCPSQQYKTTP
jgi:hypothetical protein